jgi:hypothetical protein
MDWLTGSLLLLTGGLISAFVLRFVLRIRQGDELRNFLATGIDHRKYVATISNWATRGPLPSASEASIAVLPLIAGALEKCQEEITNGDKIESFVAGHSFAEAVPELLLLLHSGLRIRYGPPLSKKPLEETTTEGETIESSSYDEGTFGWQESTTSTHYTYKVHWALVAYAAKCPLADGALRALTEARNSCSADVQARLDAAIQSYRDKAPPILEVRERNFQETIDATEVYHVDRKGRNL